MVFGFEHKMNFCCLYEKRSSGILFLIEFLLCITVITTPFTTALRRDAVVLLQVKSSQLQDPDGRLSDWKLSAPNSPCSWTAILCDNKTNAVVSIQVPSFGILGNFPSDFCRIQTLRTLDLSDNYLGGTVSSEALSLCSQLNFLNLSSNLFVGNLPELRTAFADLTTFDLSLNNFTGEIHRSYGFQLPKLQVLRLLSNFLNGSIPGFISNLTELTRLEIASNLFSPSPLPADIGRLTKLENLWFPGSNITGVIPESIGNLTSLTNLDLSYNSLTGKIPESLGSLSSVVQIELYGNNLSGEIPDVFANLTSLVNFDASQNNLNGKIPESLTGLALETLNLNDNNLEGAIPQNLALNEKLSLLRLFNNRLSGHLPENLGMNSGLNEFDVSGNFLDGPLPPNLCLKKQLEILILFNNNFSGSIPDSYGECSSLTRVRISNNKLSGVIPPNFWGFSGLDMLEISKNNFEGVIPPTVSNARELTEFLVADNNFNGPVPGEICVLEKLAVVDLSRNQFSGDLPSCMTKLSKLLKLDVQGNHITGQIPTDLTAAWPDLTDLDLSGNQISGTIPSELGGLPVLTYLDLSDNLLTGVIPDNLSKLKLNKFNVSNNRLEGRVPPSFDKGWFVSSLLGNPGLCSPDLKPFPSCNKRRATSMILVGILSGLSAILVISLLWLVIKSRKLNLFRSKSKRSWKMTSFQRLWFNQDDILAFLNKDNLIATGGSGQVYRAVLKNGQIVAVKRLWEANRGPESEEVFYSEVETLGRIRHDCIVKLLFSCSGADFRVLVYEFVENGSLGDVLHGEKGGVLLDWPRRFKIAMGAAQGLAYLHHDCVPAIIHRDVKSNNILLDEEFRPKVADFGLAKSLLKDMEEGSEMSKVAGSYGYIAPEYGYTMKITEKSDVYSFGVVLLELITGKRPVDPYFGESKDIVKWVTEVASSIPEQGGANESVGICDEFLDQIIDPRMKPSTSEMQEIKVVLNVALQCVSSLPLSRPSMRRVVELLKDKSRTRSK
ncbi:OLC1v1010572C1 [Oldenlandia corymbosa var. corymbosa]|uniref:non-specific serine/threonine protein kinase n=1 Tax=Oldenlandia corymbosa var. corymbosa TaxID=529605 RepID=A0AAV1DRM9_OLDCO|nr:OLC1v1010572C1 [Oldenlandia corymbosa var. corymbosa]